MTGSNTIFKKPVDKFETQFRPRLSLPASAYTPPRSIPKVPSITSPTRSVFASSVYQPPHQPSPSPLAISRAPLKSPNEDNPVEHTRSVESHDGHGSAYVVAPSIQVHSEFPAIIRTTDPSQPLTCIVATELPGKRPQVLFQVPGSSKLSLLSSLSSRQIPKSQASQTLPAPTPHHITLPPTA